MNSHDPVGEAQASYRIKRSRGLHAGSARDISLAVARLAVFPRSRKLSGPSGGEAQIEILSSFGTMCLQAGAWGKWRFLLSCFC